MGLPIPNEDFKRFKEIETEYLKEDLLRNFSITPARGGSKGVPKKTLNF